MNTAIRMGIVILGLCAVALTITECVDRHSRNEDDWRNQQNDRFQQDYDRKE